MTDKPIPILTDLVSSPEAPIAVSLSDDDLADLQTRIATRGYALMEKLLHEALREMEANLFADVIGRLRTELPELIDDALREHFARHSGQR